jgi:putative transposase
MNTYSKQHGVDIHAWVLMTNHIHFLVTPSTDTALSKMMQSIGRRYVRYFNTRYERTGGLWEGRFKSCLVDSETYFLQCQRYIELNPVKAGMAGHPEDYWWSSFQCHGLGKQSDMHTPHPAYLQLDEDSLRRRHKYQQLFSVPLSKETEEHIQKSVRSGLAFGSRAFRDEIEKKYGHRQHLIKPGPRV